MLAKLDDDVPTAVPLRGVRTALVVPGDLRNEIGLQNDVNALLAALAGPLSPWTPEAPLFTTPPAQPVYALHRRREALHDDLADTDAEMPVFRVAVVG